MDTTGKSYRKEDAANRELVSCLKAMNVDATYYYKLNNGKIVVF
jgi:hypothetical protein